jgi:hypothetical protein
MTIFQDALFPGYLWMEGMQTSSNGKKSETRDTSNKLLRNFSFLPTGRQSGAGHLFRIEAVAK